MSGPARVAYASAVPDGIALGTPSGRHVVLTPGEVSFRGATDEEGVLPPAVPWEQVDRLEVDAPRSPIRRPGALSVTLSTVLGAVGFEYEPMTAPAQVVVRTGDDEVEMMCDGYAGGGYWVPEGDAVGVLVDLLVDDPATRTWLTEPDRLLADLGRIAARSRAADETRRRLYAERG